MNNNPRIAAINKWLDKTYGHDLLGRPTWRLVWSEDETEKRKGTFHEFYGSIFLREFVGIREQKKYQYHPDWRNKWVLEKLMFELNNPELVLDQPGNYETIYVFYGENGEFLEPTQQAIEYFLYKLLHHTKVILTDADFDALEQVDVDKEAAEFYGMMEDKFGGDLATSIRHGEGTGYAKILPGTEFNRRV